MIEFRNVSFSYDGSPLLNDFDLQVPGGECLCVLGRSGGGKSTLLKLISGELSPVAGDVLVASKAAKLGRRDVATAAQRPHLFPWLSVADNIGFPLRARGASRCSVRAETARIAEVFDLEEHLHRSVGELSGGMAQRVSIARAFAVQPEYLLLDEPFASLDAITRLELRGWLAPRLRQSGITSFLVTHDVEDFLALGNSAIVLSRSRPLGVVTHLQRKGPSGSPVFEVEETSIRASIQAALLSDPSLGKS